MQSKIQTTDEATRKQFKASLQSRTEKAATTPVFVSDSPVERVYILPHNYEELSEAGLYTTLVRNPDWKYTLDAAQFVVSILNGREPMPSYVSFELAPAPVETKVTSTVKETVPTPKVDMEYITHTPTEVEKRMTVKAQIADKIATLEVPPLNQEAPIVEPVQVTVPVNFHTMSKSHLFGYLTHEKALTPEQVNDVIDILGGTYNPKFNIILEGIAPKEEKPVFVAHIPKRTIEIELPYGFSSLRSADKYLWLMKESQLGLSSEEANDIIDIEAGKPRITSTSFKITHAEAAPVNSSSVVELVSHSVLDEIKPVPVKYSIPVLPRDFFTAGSVEQYRILTDEIKLSPEHARFVMDSFPAIDTTVEAAEQTPNIIYVQLPLAFNSWIERDKFSYLTRYKHLSTSDAEDVITHLSGKQSLSTVLTDWEPEVDEKGKTLFVAQLAKRIENAKVLNLAPTLYEMPDLPEFFCHLDSVEQFRMLTIEKALTPEHAKFILDVLTPAIDTTAVEEERVPARTLAVSVPYAFKEWNAARQFAFLTKTKNLTSDDANDVLSYFSGSNTKTIVDLSWDELVDPEGRTSFKSILAERIANAKVKIAAPTFSEARAQRIIEATPDIGGYLTSLGISDDLTRSLVESGITFAEEEPKPVEIRISLPAAFNGLKSGEQYWYLVKTKELSRDEANDLLAVLSNKPQIGNTEFVVDWEE